MPKILEKKRNIEIPKNTHVYEIIRPGFDCSKEMENIELFTNNKIVDKSCYRCNRKSVKYFMFTYENGQCIPMNMGEKNINIHFCKHCLLECKIRLDKLWPCELCNDLYIKRKDKNNCDDCTFERKLIDKINNIFVKHNYDKDEKNIILRKILNSKK